MPINTTTASHKTHRPPCQHTCNDASNTATATTPTAQTPPTPSPLKDSRASPLAHLTACLHPPPTKQHIHTAHTVPPYITKK
ncbi:hypothetical protein XF_2399 [Xylella fastidiosa 9a5c]|uniref:Uncharacterized protein n=1 Tax=Xylella fastidiosa (strain 9a5c) TaxID=160492 RepID=Q9PAU6_XYLFA|nr:hypothetical protein XF_2399 [Xylella fastidiosa 9a5c]